VNNYIKKAAGGERLLLYNLLTWVTHFCMCMNLDWEL